jgi:hypothetical protein
VYSMVAHRTFYSIVTAAAGIGAGSFAGKFF